MRTTGADRTVADRPYLKEAEAVLREGIVADADLVDARIIFGTLRAVPRRTVALPDSRGTTS